MEVTTKNKKKKIVYNGYAYTVNYQPKKKPAVAYYECDQKWTKGCGGRAKIEGSTFVELRHDHNHDSNPFLSAALEVTLYFQFCRALKKVG